MTFEAWVALAGQIIDAAGVTAAVLGVAMASGITVFRIARREGPVYRSYRRLLGRSQS